MGKREKGDLRKTSPTKGQDEGWNRDTASEEQAVFESVEEFNAAADAYFAEADAGGKLYGEAGLCLGLSRFNRKGRNVSLATLRRWYDRGAENCPGLQEAVQMAYLRIQEQIESDAAYIGSGMGTRAIFLQKQARLGGYQDKQEGKNEVNLNISFGKNMDKSDFE